MKKFIILTAVLLAVATPLSIYAENSLYEETYDNNDKKSTQNKTVVKVTGKIETDKTDMKKLISNKIVDDSNELFDDDFLKKQASKIEEKEKKAEISDSFTKNKKEKKAETPESSEKDKKEKKTESPESFAKEKKAETSDSFAKEKKTETSDSFAKEKAEILNGELSEYFSNSKLLKYAMEEYGKPYVYGAEGPDKFDCSGFTSYVYKKAGIDIPRTSAEQAKVGDYVDKDDLQSGDLVFFDTRSKYSSIPEEEEDELFEETYKRDYLVPTKVTHVGMYIGDGSFIHASSNSHKIIIAKLNSDYFSSRYCLARRYK